MAADESPSDRDHDLWGGKTAPFREKKPMSRLMGTVRWFNNVKGYGFVGQDAGPDVFCHFSSIQTDGYKTLREGDSVEFEVIQGEKGPQTHDVRRVKPARASA